jgi:hypothetical protein
LEDDAVSIGMSSIGMSSPNLEIKACKWQQHNVSIIGMPYNKILQVISSHVDFFMKIFNWGAFENELKWYYRGRMREK